MRGGATPSGTGASPLPGEITSGLGAGVSPSLSETVGAFCRDMLRMRRELHQARAEILRLQKALETRTQAGDARPVKRLRRDEVRLLRRQISFRCHPDRGGDGRLMQQVNSFFDVLEEALESQTHDA